MLPKHPIYLRRMEYGVWTSYSNNEMKPRQRTQAWHPAPITRGLAARPPARQSRRIISLSRPDPSPHCLAPTIKIQFHLTPQSSTPQTPRPNPPNTNKMDYDDSNRAFLQAFMARSTLTFSEAKPILAAIYSIKSYPPSPPLPPQIQPISH